MKKQSKRQRANRKNQLIANQQANKNDAYPLAYRVNTIFSFPTSKIKSYNSTLL